MVYGIKVSFIVRINDVQIKGGCGITFEYCVKRSYDVTWQGYLHLYKTNHLKGLYVISALLLRRV